MRILTLSYEFPPLGGGGAKVVDGLARQLVQLGNEVDVVTMGFPGLPDYEEVEGINVFRLTSRRKRPDICHTREMVPHLASAYSRVKRLLATRKYNINHTHFIFPDGVLAWRLAQTSGMPYVITAHGSDVPGFNPDRFMFQHFMLLPLWRRVVRNATRVICPSVYLQGLLNKNDSSAKSEIIPNGMYASKFNPAREKRMRILVVTRMFERKGVQYLLEALRGRTLDCEINVVGDGPYLETLKQKASHTRATIRFWGWLDNNSDELKELYETSRIFVFTSQQENFPVNLLEAMTAGMAIVISEDPGSAEVVGDAALRVPDNQPEQFFETLQRLVRDPVLCNDLGSRARQRLEAHFTWPVVARRYQNLFERVLG